MDENQEMNGWSYDVDELPDLAIIGGGNASGKTHLLQRIIHWKGAEHEIRYISVERLGLGTGRGHMNLSAHQRIQSRMSSLLNSLDNENLVVLVDDTGLLTDAEFKEICASLKQLYGKGRIHGAAITRHEKEFIVRSLKRET